MPENRILYIDHRPELLKAYAILLSKRGFQVEALTDYEPSSPFAFDVLLYGVRDPDVQHGRSLLHALRSERYLPAVATSSFLMQETQDRIRSAGFDFVIPEPISIQTLEFALRTCARSHHRIRE